MPAASLHTLSCLPGKGPHPAVIYGHWCMPGSAKMNRTEFLDEALLLAKSGVISLLPNHVITNQGFVEDKSELNEQQIDVLVQQVTNMRRGVDLLLARKDVAPDRIAFVGHSCNGQVAALLSGIDERFKAIVIMASGLSDQVDVKTEQYQDYRKRSAKRNLMPSLPRITGRIPGNTFRNPTT